MGKQERQQKREAIAEPQPKALFVALVPDGGGYRIAKALLDVDAVALIEPTLSEPEVFSVQLSLASQALEDYARNEGDGVQAQAVCPQCGVAALRKHPSKPVKVCSNGACNARVEL